MASRNQPSGSLKGSPLMSENLIQAASREALKSTPPVVVTSIALIERGLPFVISFLTLIYLSIQIAHLLWKWLAEIEAKRKGLQPEADDE